MAKTDNDYQYAAGATFYTDTPKAVWAALAISLMEQIYTGSLQDQSWMQTLLTTEWQALHDNGIVPRRPPK